MRHIHITQQLFEASRSGRIPTSAVLELAALHLSSICEVCRQQALYAKDLLEMEAGSVPSTGSLRLPAPGSALSESQASEVTAAVLGRLRRDWEREEVTAEAELRELLALPQEERLRTVRGARTRFRSLRLANLLLAEARGAVSEGPEAVFDRAHLAEEVASRARVMGRALPQLQAEARAVALAWQGNARRLAADFRAAERHLARALDTLRKGEIVDPAPQAEVYRLHAGFLVDIFDPGAEMMGIRAVQLSQLAQDREGEARALLVLGVHYHQLGNALEALNMAEAALQVLPSPDFPSKIEKGPPFLV